MSKYLLSLPFLFYFFSCSSDKQLEQKEENTTIKSVYKDGNLIVHASSTEKLEGLSITNFAADTGVNKKEQGIRTYFIMTVNKHILDQIHADGFDALLVDVVCKGNSGKSFSYLTTYLPELSGKVVYPDKNIVFSHPSSRGIQIDIPYRKLELAAGKQPLTFSLLVYPIKFAVDTNRVETKHIERMGSNPIYSQTYSTAVNTPQLKVNTISITDVKIKTEKKKASSYDFTLIGSGLPDPYWQIWCGEELIYFSPAEKNSLTINGTNSSSNFYTAANDIITIKFLDYDNGPFNRDDQIETVEGTPSELKKLKRINGTTISAAAIKLSQQ
ncbi:hypothetical protein [Cytophaga aurantiaca]|uniref:hypothetical protein n=1 Tax=Cytophaga aurantiaca TaxID=29530 RepID=UPI00035F4378|nr:hypothetical protein [Cytophaga aurantiaca]